MKLLYLDCTKGATTEEIARVLNALCEGERKPTHIDATKEAICETLEKIAPDRTVISPICVGNTSLNAEVLSILASENAKICAGEGRCTKEAAEILCDMADGFSEVPEMRLNKTASFGSVTALIGETDTPSRGIIELQCSVDDMTPEAVGFCTDVLFRAGALEVYTVPLNMKKSRPGVLLSVTCREEARENMLSLIFRHTSTLGVREVCQRRHMLDREIHVVKTPFGEVRKKIACGYGVEKEKWEYEDLARLSRETGLTLNEIKTELDRKS